MKPQDPAHAGRGRGSNRDFISARATILSSLTALAIAVCAPLSAQQGRDLLTQDELPREEVLVKEAARDIVVQEAGDLSLVDAMSSDPTGVASAATTEYKYDDGTPESHTSIRNAYEQEYAQRFRLPRAGTVTSVTLCFTRPDVDADEVSAVATFYRDSAGRPGTRLAAFRYTIRGLSRNTWACVDLRQGSITQQRLQSGDTWLSVTWPNSSGWVYPEDRNGPGGTRNYWRSRSSSSASWGSWNAETVATAYFIRLGVDHGGGTPPPDPDPEPPPTSGCRPTTTALRFDGGYNVSMCYRTPDGQEGQAKSGVWASSQSGILWFFDRENAEVLVKVLDGCDHNGHRWVFVAPVTTLEFNLWVTGPNGKRWTHTNRQNQTASAKSDTTAFQCSGGGSSAPDLVVSRPSVSNSSPSAGGSFTLRTTVRNQGSGRSAATTLRYYRSSNSTISSSGSQVGTDAVSALSASGSSAESISLRAPSSAGTYYYGACVDSVSSESNTGNNCSSAVRVTVSGGGTSGTTYSVGDVITTLPTGSWFPNVCTGGCSLSGNVKTVNSRGGYIEYGSYRYTCEASSCQIDGRTVTRGTWLETRR
ncbi:MAG: hypothetical protein F4112_00610 [Holophagales bacterium]|nr:hypothetical protein [Holophagales bacterium]MYD22576.1 hypothetical protein [Holophagales bacterium]MYI31446.1 hypothetical protein [Holophagales bacterium]